MVIVSLTNLKRGSAVILYTVEPVMQLKISQYFTFTDKIRFSDIYRQYRFLDYFPGRLLSL